MALLCIAALVNFHFTCGHSACLTIPQATKRTLSPQPRIVANEVKGDIKIQPYLTLFDRSHLNYYTLENVRREASSHRQSTTASGNFSFKSVGIIST